MKRPGWMGVVGALACVAAPAWATTGSGSVEVLGSNSQDFVGDFDFQVPTNASGFSGPSVSPSGWVFFTMGVKDGTGTGLGDALFASNGGLTQMLLGPAELGAERSIEETIAVPDVPRIRATGRDSVLLRATVGDTDGLWDVSPVDGTAELVAEEGVGGLAQIGVLQGSTADQFWGDERGLVTFVAQPGFVPTVFSYDGKTSTPLLAENGTVAGTGGMAGQLKSVGITEAGEVIVVTPLTVNQGGPRLFDAVLRYTPGLGVEWEVLAGSPTPSAGGIATIDDRIHIGKGGHVVFRGTHYTEETSPGSGFWNTAQSLMRVLPDGTVEVLTDDIDPADIFAIDATHVTPTGDVYAAVDSFGGSDKLLYAASGDIAEVMFTEGKANVFGLGGFVSAYGFSSVADGRVYVSGESTLGQVVTETSPDAASFEVISSEWPLTVDGEERFAEALYFDGVGPFASSDGAVVCARVDLDAPTDVGVVCTADPNQDDPGSIQGDITLAELVRVVTGAYTYTPGDVRYEFWVDVDIEVSEGFWQVDLDLLGDTPLEGEVRVVNRLDGQIETTCTATPQQVRCGEVVATDPVALQLRMIFTPSSPTGHDLTLTLRGSNDGPEVQLDQQEVTLLALEQTLEPAEEGSGCLLRTLASVDGVDAQLVYPPTQQVIPDDLPVLDVRADSIEDGYKTGLFFQTKMDGVGIEMPMGSYVLEVMPLTGGAFEDCSRFAVDCSEARQTNAYELDLSDNIQDSSCIRNATGDELKDAEKACKCSSSHVGSLAWMLLVVPVLLARRRAR